MVSASAYAKHRGVSLQAVMAAINDGRLTEAAVQKMESGRYRVNVEAADREWQANTDGGTGYLAHTENADVVPDDTEDTPATDEPITYAQARAQHERFKARLAQLELEQREGKLVEADQVQREAYRVARVVRDALLNLPDRVAGELAAETNQFKVHQRLTQEIRRALEDLNID